MSAKDFTVRQADGTPLTLHSLPGPLLIVNVASRCGFTPQYSGLETLHRRFGARGLHVLAFPCNQFAGQEPGGADEIATFCRTSYDVTFPVLAKVEVNGSGAEPFWRYLKAQKPGLLGVQAIKWNFTKFLVDRDGRVVSRHAPTETPESLIPAIKRLL